MKHPVFPLAVLAALAAAPAQAICVTGAKCVTVPQSQKTPPKWVPGDVLKPGSYQMILNAPHFGLPRSDGSSWYVRVDDRALRVRPNTFEVIEDVTQLTNRSF